MTERERDGWGGGEGERKMIMISKTANRGQLFPCHVILKEMLFEWSNLDEIFMTKLEILIENSVESNIVGIYFKFHHNSFLTATDVFVVKNDEVSIVSIMMNKPNKKGAFWSL